MTAGARGAGSQDDLWLLFILPVDCKLAANALYGLRPQTLTQQGACFAGRERRGVIKGAFDQLACFQCIIRFLDGSVGYAFFADIQHRLQSVA